MDPEPKGSETCWPRHTWARSSAQAFTSEGVGLALFTNFSFPSFPLKALKLPYVPNAWCHLQVVNNEWWHSVF